jgi:hypothetical protein
MHGLKLPETRQAAATAHGEILIRQFLDKTVPKGSRILQHDDVPILDHVYPPANHKTTNVIYLNTNVVEAQASIGA